VRRPGLAAVLIAACLSAAPGARAEPPPAQDWEVEILAYGWVPALDAELRGPLGANRNLDWGIDDVLENLDFAAMGRVGARWRRWVLAVDGLWTKLGDDVDFGRGPIRFEGDFEQALALVQVLGGYRVFAREGGLFGTPGPGDGRRFGVDVLAGANYVYLSADFELERSSIGPLPGRQRHFGDSNDWLAPAVGLRFQNDFTERLRFETLGVASGFGVGDAPDVSWQLTTLLSYRFTDHWLASIGHRLITAESSGGFEPELRMHGPIVGIGYRF